MMMYCKTIENYQRLVEEMECEIYHYKTKNKKKIYKQFTRKKENGEK